MMRDATSPEPLETRLVGAMRSPGQGADIAATRHAGLARLEPMTPRARDWIERVAIGETSRDGDALVVEMRYFADIAEHAIATGLTFERDETLN